METAELKLLAPVTIDGDTTATLVLKELTVEQLLVLERSHGGKTAFEQDVYTFAMSCGVAPDVIKKLGQRDWQRLKMKYWETLGNVVDDQEDQT